MDITTAEAGFIDLLKRTKQLQKDDVGKNMWRISSNAEILTGYLDRMKDEGLSEAYLINQYQEDIDQLKANVEIERKRSKYEELSTHAPTHDVNFATTSDQKRSADFYNASLREELLGNAKDTVMSDDLMTHERAQEGLAEELLQMTRSLKTNMKMAGTIIQEDNKRLTAMQTQVDKNKERLSVEGERLAKHAYKCGTECFMILFCLFLFWSFICMVIVMKIFPKTTIA